MPSKSDAETARLAFVAIQYREEFGAVLRARRKEIGLTQSQVADRVERWLVEHGKREPGEPFDPQNVSRWERGKNLGTIDNQEAVAAALETTMAGLVAQIAKPNGKSTPDLMGAVNGDKPDGDDLRERLDRIEENQRALDTKLDGLAGTLAMVAQMLSDESAPKRRRAS